MPNLIHKAPLRIVSHRCKGFQQPENSAAALQAALFSDVDEVELDFRTTRDGELVASHFDLFFDTRRFPHIVSRGSLLQNERHGLMSLKKCLEIFRSYGEGKKLRLEVKSPAVEHKVFQTIRDFDLLDRVVVVSWNISSLKSFRVLSDSLELSLSFILGLQGDGLLPLCWPSTVPVALRDATLRVRSVNVIGSFMRLSPQYVAKLLACGVEVFSLARGTPDDIRQLQFLGVTGALFSSIPCMSHDSGVC